MSDRRARAQRANSPLGRALRYVGLLIGIIGGWQLGLMLEPVNTATGEYGFPLLFAAATGALFFLITPYVTLGLFDWLRHEIRRLSASDLVAAGVGLLVGGLVSSLLAWPISLLPEPWGGLLPTLTALAICSISLVAVITKKRELMQLLRRPIEAAPVAPAERTAEDRRILLDTSTIIDGRIADLAQTGILETLVVPGFVLRELQLVADSTDPGRRQRGRRGLDVLERLRREPAIQFEILDQDAHEEPDVDGKLIRLAQAHGWRLMTGDQNLERVATLQGVKVLNIHYLSHVLRPMVVPGEEMPLRIVQPGREYDQGVGFLEDGTMVVVEAGRNFIGKDVTVVVTRTLQTGGGRMAFAQIKNRESA